MKKRIEWIDLARGFAIYLVILGHTIQFIFPEEKFIFRIIYSFHMPLFFILCGCTFQIRNDQTCLDLIKKKIISYGKPYFIFVIIDLIGMFIKCLKYGVFSVNVKALFCTVFMTYDSLFSELWFFPCLFIAEIILYFVYKYISNIRVRIIAVILIACCGYFINTTGILLPLQLDVAMFVQLFIFVGVETKQFNHNIGLIKELIFLFIFLSINIYIFSVGGIVDGVYKLDVYNPILFIITGITGTMSSIVVIKKMTKAHVKLFLKIGRNSAYIYGLHYYLLRICCKFTERMHFGVKYFNIIFTFLLSFILMIITEMIIDIIQLAENTLVPYTIKLLRGRNEKNNCL